MKQPSYETIRAMVPLQLQILNIVQSNGTCIIVDKLLDDTGPEVVLGKRDEEELIDIATRISMILETAILTLQEKYLWYLYTKVD